MDAASPARMILNLKVVGIDLKRAGGDARRDSGKGERISASLAASAMLDLMTDLF